MVLPAYAGMIPRVYDQFQVLYRAPRVCGDDPVSVSRYASSARCSPRMRG